MNTMLNHPIQIFWMLLGWAILIIIGFFAISLLLYLFNNSPRILGWATLILLRMSGIVFILLTFGALFLWIGWKIIAFLWNHSTGFSTVAGIPLALVAWGAAIYGLYELLARFSLRHEIDKKYLTWEGRVIKRIESIDTLGGIIGRLTKRKSSQREAIGGKASIGEP